MKKQEIITQFQASSLEEEQHKRVRFCIFCSIFTLSEALLKCGYISQWDWVSVNLIVTIFECERKISTRCCCFRYVWMGLEWGWGAVLCARFACMKMRVVPLLTCLQRCFQPTLQISLGSAQQSPRTEPRFTLLAASATASSSRLLYVAPFF